MICQIRAEWALSWLQFAQNQSPSGAVSMSRQSKWNHWITHSGFSQKIISPCSASLHMHQTGFSATTIGISIRTATDSRRCWIASGYRILPWTAIVFRRWRTGCAWRWGERRATSAAIVLRRWRTGCGTEFWIAIKFWPVKILIARARLRVTID